LSIWLSLVPFVVGDDDAVVKNQHARCNFVSNAYLLLQVVTFIWQNSAPTSDDLDILEGTIREWSTHFNLFFSCTSPSGCCFDNFHKIQHACWFARRDGGLASTCTSSWERSHTEFAKDPAKHTNRKGGVDRKMLQVIQTQDRIDDIWKDRAFSCFDDVCSADDCSMQQSRTSSTSGSVNRVARRTSLMIYMYFRLRLVVLPPITQQSFLRELRVAYDGEVSADSVRGIECEGAVNEATITLGEVLCWQFLRFRKAGENAEIVIRAPKGLNVTCVHCGDESYAQVLAIVDVRQRTFLFVRWFTPTFPGSNAHVPGRAAVAARYTTLMLTNKTVAITLDQVVSTVHIVPHFIKGHPYFFLNTLPLGSTLRARSWECMLSESERIVS
jgi:hypothetical protein